MAGGKKTSKGAAASAAAHAASKRKSAAVEMTADNEARVRSALEGLDIKPAAASSGGRRAGAEQIGEVYDRLVTHGFQQQHVQQALQALAGGEVSEEAALDWLCLHVDPAQLPRRFAGHARGRAAAAGVKVLATADKAPLQHRARVEAVEIPGMQKAKPLDTVAEARAAKVRQEKEKESQRAWIMQYMEHDDSSDAASDQADEAIEDWELWGDPREIERRKAERKRQNLPSEQRRQQLAEEWVHAKGEAARAKAAADKPRQKAAGGVIRDLKLEMKQIGLTEEDAERMAAPSDGNAATLEVTALDDESSWPSLGGEEASQLASAPVLASAGSADSASYEKGTVPARAEEKVDFDTDLLLPTISRRPKLDAGSSKPQADEESGSEGGMDLFFDEDALAADFGMEPGVAKAPARAPAPPAPWGVDGSKKAPKKKGLKGRPVKSVAEVKAPKSMLQQFCQKEQRAPPRFERLPPGGNRLPTAGIRYSVTVDNAPQKGGGKRGKSVTQRTLALREDDDGWETIQDAQNAAATLALYQVGQDRSVWQHLPEVFQGMWLAWEEQGDSNPGADAANEADRLAFVESLASQSAASRRPASAASSQTQPVEENGVTTGNGSAHGSASEPKGLSRAALEESRRMQQRLDHFRGSPEGQEWIRHRRNLPVWAIKDALLAAVATADVVVVGGDTGCGKTTQVPQFLLDASISAGLGGACSIICTQPRRIAAISVAERVCQEREDSAPGTRGSAIGYHVRLDAASTRDTKLLFCTTGILLRRLSSDPLLSGTSHVIVDEVHERTLQGDFLMALLKDIVATRRAQGNPLKVVLMSATLDSELFARYFGGSPTLAAGGRTFPVEHLFLEDVYELTNYRLDAEGPNALRGTSDGAKRRALQKAAGSQQSLLKAGWGDDEAGGGVSNPHYNPELYASYSANVRKNLAHLDENRIDYELLEELLTQLAADPAEGAILLFLPGMGEITSMYERLSAHRAYREGRRWVLPLHSSVSPQEQRKTFEVPPPGVRKIVLATNIAETSLTISDVTMVVDAGKLKERRYDASRGMSLLLEDWVSRANALQRKGRAGRVQAGKCYGLYTRHRFEHRMRPYQAPEMVRVPLEELVLQIQLLKLGPTAAFLEQVIEPPPPRSVQAAVAQLQAVGALSAEEQLTPLGHHLAQLPVDARVGKLLLLGASLECLAPVLTIAACLSYKSPFSAPFDQQDAAQRIKVALATAGSGNIASGQQSDHLLMAAVYQGWVQIASKAGRREAATYARKHMLSQQTLEMLGDMRWQFASVLADSKFIMAPGTHRGAASKDRLWVDDPKQPWNKQAHQPSLVKAVLCAALYPNVAVMDDSAGKTTRPAWNDGNAAVFIHPSSINHALDAHQFLRPYLMYLEKVKTTRTFLRDCTVVSPMALLLFGGELQVVHEEGYVLIDGWIRIRAAAPTAVLVKQLRAAINALLQQKIGRPEMDLTAAGGALVETLVKLLSDEESARQWDRQ